jgi:predicted nucleic acid-binding Zn ribbon protein
MELRKFRICGYCGSAMEPDQEVCINCIRKIIQEIDYLKKENKLLTRVFNMMLEAQGLSIDRPDNAMDYFMGNDIMDSTLRIQRVSSPRI